MAPEPAIAAGSGVNDKLMKRLPAWCCYRICKFHQAIEKTNDKLMKRLPAWCCYRICKFHQAIEKTNDKLMKRLPAWYSKSHVRVPSGH